MPIVKKYKSVVKDIKNPVENVYTVNFFSEKKFIFNPGQFLHLALDDYDGIGQWPESRCFSMQSNPEDELLKITFAVKGNYTNRMSHELLNGKEVWLKLPYGDLFDRGHVKENCIFIAGGTGITPLLSLFTSNSFIGYTNPKLYLGIRDERFNIYGKELEDALTRNPKLKINIICQDKKGILDIEKIFNENELDSTFFISGPGVMIQSFKNYLLKKNISITKIITDEWE